VGRALGETGAWLELAWDKPQSLRQVQLTFDSGFIRELTLSSSAAANVNIIRAPQPETVKNTRFNIKLKTGKEWQELAKLDGNHQRLRPPRFQTP